MSEYIIETEISNGSLFIPYQSKLSESVREEIVRCGDCEHYNPNDAGCMYWVMASNKLLHVNTPDGFCKWGERRDA